MCEWIQRTQQPVAWLSLDKGDNDPTRFWAYFIAAVQTIPSLSEAGVGETVLAVLESPQPPPLESVLTDLINEIAAIPAPFAYRLLSAVSSIAPDRAGCHLSKVRFGG